MSSTPSGTDRQTINSATGSQPADQASARGGIFKDFSGVTVIASTLASCTSFLLSNSIGIAGSLIGALVGGLASAAGLQIYKAILIQTGDKFREVTEERLGGLTQQSAPVDVGTPADAEATRTDTGQVDATQVLDTSDEGWQPTSVSGQAAVEATSATGTPIAPDAVAEAAHDRERRRHQRRLIVIMVVAALVAVLVTAGVITLVTQGEGIGPTAEEVVEEIEVALEATESSEDADEEAVEEGSEDDAAASDGAVTDAGDDSEDGTDEDDAASATGEGDASADASTDDAAASDSASDATDATDADSAGSDVTSSDVAETQTDEGTSDSSASDAATTTSEAAE